MIFQASVQREEGLRRKNREAKPVLMGLEDRALLSASPLVGASLTKAQAYVSSVYQELLGRTPDPAALSSFTTALQAGATTPKKVVSTIQKSVEYRTEEVTSIYYQVFNRAPDQQGLSSGVKYLSTKGSLNSLMIKLVASQEFFVAAGNTNQAFVSRLYAVALERSPDTSATALVDSLNSGASLTKIAGEVINSKEAAGTAVSNLYGGFLGRTTDNTAQAFAAQISQTHGAAYEQVILNLATSNEYVTRVTAGA